MVDGVTLGTCVVARFDMRMVGRAPGKLVSPNTISMADESSAGIEYGTDERNIGLSLFLIAFLK